MSAAYPSSTGAQPSARPSASGATNVPQLRNNSQDLEASRQPEQDRSVQFSTSTGIQTAGYEENDTTAFSHKHKHSYPEPLLRLHIEDLAHPGAKLFLDAVDPVKVMRQAVETTMQILYNEAPLTSPRRSATQPDPEDSSAESFEDADDVETERHRHKGPWPEVRSITLILDKHGGVAQTSGIALDPTHKQIQLNMGYVRNVAPKPDDTQQSLASDGSSVVTAANSVVPTPLPGSSTVAPVPQPDRLTAELTGVLLHEVVHTLQHARMREIPGGLIEGIADWVRLRAGLAPPHWRRETKDKKWDEGYATTAWFLDWLEEVRFGKGVVWRVNQMLSSTGKYKSDDFWGELAKSATGEHLKHGVEGLWQEYVQWLEGACANGG